MREERKDRDNREWKKHEPRQKGRLYLFVGRKKLGEKIQVSAESWRRNQSKNLKHKTFLFFFLLCDNSKERKNERNEKLFVGTVKGEKFYQSSKFKFKIESIEIRIKFEKRSR